MEKYTTNDLKNFIVQFNRSYDSNGGTVDAATQETIIDYLIDLAKYKNLLDLGLLMKRPWSTIYILAYTKRKEQMIPQISMYDPPSTEALINYIDWATKEGHEIFYDPNKAIIALQKALY